MYDAFAAKAVDAVGGVKNIASVTHCATRLRFQLKDSGLADKAAIEALPEAVAVVESGGQLQVVIGMQVPDAHAAVLRIPGVPQGGPASGDYSAEKEAVKLAKNGSVLDRILGAISAIFTPYIPVLASVGIIKGLIDLAVNRGWLETESSTYLILQAPWTAMIYFFPVLLAFTGAKRFGANPYVGALIGASLVEPSLVAGIPTGTSTHFIGIPFIAQSFANSVIPIIVGMWAFGYVEKYLKKYLPKVTHLLLVPVISILIMVPLMMLVFGPVGALIANAIADAYQWLVNYPILLSLIFGGFFIYVIMIGAHWVVLPIQLGILADQGMEYSLAAGGMGNYALLGVMLAVLLFNRDKVTRATAGSAAFVNALSGITEPGLFGVVMKNKRYFVGLTLGGLAGGLVCGIFGTYITSFAFTGLFGLPAFLSGPKAGSYFLAVAVTILTGFLVTWVMEKSMRQKGIDTSTPVVTSA